MNKKCPECNYTFNIQRFEDRNGKECKRCCTCRCVCHECYYKFKNKNSLIKHMENKHDFLLLDSRLVRQNNSNEEKTWTARPGFFGISNCSTFPIGYDSDRYMSEESEYEEHIPGFYSPRRDDNTLKISKLSIEDEKTPSDSKKCIICTENKAIMLYDPCGHIFSCNSCFQKNPKTECSICRTIPKNVIRAYYPD